MIRHMLNFDFKSVLDIENKLFFCPWTKKDFLDSFVDKCNCYVYETNGSIVGYVVFKKNKYSIDILNIAVHEKFQLKNIGKELIDHVKNKLKNKRYYINVNVRETNLGCQLFLKRQEFKAIAVCEKYFYNEKNEEYEDSYLFAYNNI